MRFAIKKTKLSEWSMVYYNNVLAIPTLIPFMYLNGELPNFFYDYTLYVNFSVENLIFIANLHQDLPPWYSFVV